MEGETPAISGEKEASEERHGPLLRHLKNAVSVLLEIAKIPPRQVEEEERFLRASHDEGEIETTTRKYPLYRQSQVAYAVTRVLRETEDPLFCEFSGQFRRSATFEEVQVARDKHERCLVEGFCYFKYKMPEPRDGPHDPAPVPLILNADLTGWTCGVTVYSKVNRLDAVTAFLREIDTILVEKNYLKGEKLELRARGQFGFFEYEDLGWDDVILDKDVLEEIHRQLVYPVTHEDTYRRLNLPWKRGLLWHGIPGTGKTHFGKIVCNKVPCTFIWVTMKALEGSNDVRRLYGAARELAPVIVFWEDIDLIGGNRRDGHFSPILGELLNQLDGVSPLDGVFTVATTNFVENLDWALSRRPARFDIRLPFDLPDPELRARIFKLFVENHEVSGAIGYPELAKASHDMSGAAIGEVVIRAVQRSLENGADGTINHQDLVWAVGRVKHFGQKQFGFLPGARREEEDG